MLADTVIAIRPVTAWRDTRITVVKEHRPVQQLPAQHACIVGLVAVPTAQRGVREMRSTLPMKKEGFGAPCCLATVARSRRFSLHIAERRALRQGHSPRRIPLGARGLLLFLQVRQPHVSIFGTSATCGCRAAESVLAFASFALSCKAVALARFSASNAASTVAACARR
jgi:hypothetical protein